MTFPAWLRLHPDGCVVQILAQPGARRDQVIGEHGDRIKVAVRAPPEDGKANAALEDLLARALGCRCRVIQGATDRRKAVCCACPPDRALALTTASE